jgi:predicted secreted protein
MIKLSAVAMLAIASFSATAPLSAHEEQSHYDRINLSASAGREVDTDTLVAVLYKQHQSTNQATASDEVNAAVRWAIEQARAANVKVTTSSYRTQPIYQKQHIQSWRVHQSIRIESTDAKQLAKLLGILQQKLSIQSLRDELSATARKSAQEALIADALNAFQERAAAIAKTLGRSGHRIVNININAGGERPPPRTLMREAVTMQSSVTAAPPAIESGSLRVEVRVSGTIELIAP